MIAVRGLLETPEYITLLLDPYIETFALIPIFLIVFLRNVLTHHASEWTQDKPPLVFYRYSRNRIQFNNSTARSIRTRKNSQWIPLQVCQFLYIVYIYALHGL